MKRFLCLNLIMFALGSLYLRAQQEQNGYINLPLPRWSEPILQNGKEHHFIRHDIINNNTSVIDTVAENVYGETYCSAAFNNDNPDLPTGEYAGEKNFNDLSLIADPSQFPWRVNVKLFMRFPNNAQYVGSGVLINQRWVLTAGHCVYSHDDGGWPSEIEVVPAYNAGLKPYGSAYATYCYSWSGWTVSKDFSWDMGYIYLDQSIGSNTGYYGFGYNNDNSFFSGNTFHNPGYPAESPYNGSQMYYWYGNYDIVYTKLLYFDKYCYGGQSGSGSYYKDAQDNRYVYAVLSHVNSNNQTGHVRITGEMFTDIYGHIYGSEETQNASELISLSPNPASDKVIITGVSYGENIQIYNLQANCVLSKTASGQRVAIDISKLKPGIYFVRINGVVRKSATLIKR